MIPFRQYLNQKLQPINTDNMKTMLLVISIFIAEVASAGINGSFFIEENPSKDQLLLAAKGEEGLFEEGITSEVWLNACIGLWNDYYFKTGKKLPFDEEGHASVVDRLEKQTKVMTLPGGTEIYEAYWKNGEIKRRKRQSLDGEEFLVTIQKGRVLISLHCGNPVFCKQTFGEEKETIPAPDPELQRPLAQKPETLYIERVVEKLVTQQPAAVSTSAQPQILVVYWPLPSYPANYGSGSYPSYAYPGYPYSSGSYYSSPGISFGVRFGSSGCGSPWGNGYYGSSYSGCGQPVFSNYSPPPTSCGPRK